jgi:hypothetical protein
MEWERKDHNRVYVAGHSSLRCGDYRDLMRSAEKTIQRVTTIWNSKLFILLDFNNFLDSLYYWLFLFKDECLALWGTVSGRCKKLARPPNFWGTMFNLLGWLTVCKSFFFYYLNRKLPFYIKQNNLFLLWESDI